MARKPNYGFERRERDKARANKKAERVRAKQEKSNMRKQASHDDEHKPEETTSLPEGLPD